MTLLNDLLLNDLHHFHFDVALQVAAKIVQRVNGCGQRSPFHNFSKHNFSSLRLCRFGFRDFGNQLIDHADGLVDGGLDRLTKAGLTVGIGIDG